MTTYKRNPKLADLKTRIKALACDGRTIREDARTLAGEERHSKKQDALYVGSEARVLLLAYGYLRGRSIAQMESEFSRPENLIPASAIVSTAMGYYPDRGEDESQEDYAATLAALKAHIESDLKAWRKTILIKATERDSRRRLAKVA